MLSRRGLRSSSSSTLSNAELFGSSGGCYPVGKWRGKGDIYYISTQFVKSGGFILRKRGHYYISTQFAKSGGFILRHS